MKKYTVVGFDPNSHRSEKPGVFVDQFEAKNPEHCTALEIENRPKCHIFAMFHGWHEDISKEWKFPLRVREVARVINPNAYQPWTPTEEQTLEQLHKEKAPMSEICLKTGRSKGAVRTHLEKLQIVSKTKRRNRFSVDVSRWTRYYDAMPDEPLATLDGDKETAKAAVVSIEKGFIVKAANDAEIVFETLADAQIVGQLAFKS